MVYAARGIGTLSGEQRRPDSGYLVLGLTGSFGSGCSEVAEILRCGKDYRVVSISGILEKESEHRQEELPDSPQQRRQALQELGNRLRGERGNGVLVKMALEQAVGEDKDRPLVLDSLKNPGEIAELRELPNSYVVAVDASRRNRWGRIAAQSDYEEKLFRRNDQVDKDEGLKYGQRVQACVDRADIVISNEEDWGDSPRKKEKFRSKVLGYVHLLEEPGYREPTFRELAMNNAYSTSLRSRCLSRRVGAVIVSQKIENAPYYVLATGYNHVPPRSRECIEEFHECYRAMKKKEVLDSLKFCPGCGSGLEDARCDNSDCHYSMAQGNLLDRIMPGKGLDLCRASHAEESAILQTCVLGGPSPRDGIMFTTTFPCPLCAKMIVGAGIREVAYVEPYPMPESIAILENADVDLTRFEGVKAQAFVRLFGGYGSRAGGQGSRGDTENG